MRPHEIFAAPQSSVSLNAATGITSSAISTLNPNLQVKLSVGSILNDRFEILAELGEGGFGLVYKAFDRSLNRTVALKQLKAHSFMSEDEFKRFLRESQILSKLKHPNIVSVYAIEQMTGQEPFLVMEFVDGKSLKDLIAEQSGGLPANQCKQVFMQISEAIAYAHAQGAIHRDLSPTNVLITNQETELKAQIIDFGLSKLLDQASDNKLTKTGRLMGNPAYMSPEACMGQQVDAQSDIYSLGCVLYEMLAGQPPFEAQEAIGLLYKQMNEYPNEPNLSWEDKEQAALLKQICMLCLQKKKEARPDSVAIIVEWLRKGQPPEAGNTWQGSSPKRSPATTGKIAVGICVLLILASGTIFFFMRPLPKQSAPLNLKNQDSRARILQRRLKQNIARFGEDSPSLVKPYYALADYYYHSTNDLDSTLGYLKKLLQLQFKYHLDKIDEKTDFIDVLRMQVGCLQEKKEFAAAEKEIFTALNIIKQKQDAGNSQVYVDWLRRLASNYAYQRNFAKAESIYLECLKLAQDQDTFTKLDLHMQIANFYLFDKMDSAKALPLIEQTRKLMDEMIASKGATPLYENSNANITLAAVQSLANSYRFLNKYQDSEKVARQGIAFCSSVPYLNENEIWRARLLEHIAYCKSESGQYSEARKLCKQAHDLIEKTYSLQLSNLALSQYRSLAWCYWACGYSADAIPVLRKALDITQKVNGPTAEITRIVLHELAFSYLRVGSLKEAEALYKQILSSSSNPFPNDHHRTNRAKEELGQIYLQLNRPVEARLMLEQSIDDADKEKFPAANNRFDLTQVFLKQNEPENAEKNLWTAVRDARLENQRDTTFRVGSGAADFFMEKKDYKQAVLVLQNTLEAQNIHRPDDEAKRVVLLEKLATCFEKIGKSSMAKDCIQRARNISANSKAEKWSGR